MRSIPPSPIPWQVTGNHWISLPCIHPANGAIHALGVLHRGARGAVEFAGDPGFLAGSGPALLRPALRVNGVRRELGGDGGAVAWERALQWLPTFTATLDNTLVVRGTVFAPHGRDADLSGVVYTLAVENRGGDPVDIDLALEGTLGHRPAAGTLAAPVCRPSARCRGSERRRRARRDSAPRAGRARNRGRW